MSPEKNIEELIIHMDQLPSLPAVAVQAMDLAMDKKASMDRIANIVEKDAAITSRILKTANSPFFGRPGRVSNLQQAIVLLGTNSLRSLVLTVSVVDTFKKSDIKDIEVFPKKYLWQHSLLVAIGARLLCDTLKIDGADDMFIAGLLHDIGINLLGVGFPEEYRNITEEFQWGTESLISLENEIIGINHAQAGELMLEHWKFPLVTSQLVRYHHDLNDIPKDDSGLKIKSQILNVADAFAFHAGYGFTIGAPLVGFDEQIIEDIGLEPEDASQIKQRMIDNLEELSDLFELEKIQSEEYVSRVQKANMLLAEKSVELDHRIRDLSLLNEINNQMTSSINIEELLKIMAKSLQPVADLSAVAIMLDDAENPLYSMNLFKPISKDHFESISRNTLTALTAENGKSISISKLKLSLNNRSMMQSLGKTSEEPLEMESFPLRVKGNVLGVVSVCTAPNQVLLQRELDLFETIFGSMGIAVENALLHETMKHQALTDGLTGLYNHRTFQDFLDKEMLRSVREGKKLSLLIIDIDFFKKINDNYGHPTGDQVLKHVVKELNESMRPYDVICRYGGEEFSAILRDVGSETAQSIAERLRSKIEEAPYQNGTATIPITVSMGVATYPEEDISTKPSLIEAADKALYQAKQGGRNRVVVFKHNS